MTKVLVVGNAGFIGRNLMQALGRQNAIIVNGFDISDNPKDLDTYLAEADLVYHFAGVNRPQKPDEYELGNVGITRNIVRRLEALERAPLVVYLSSIQATFDNPYGKSKLQAEEVLRVWATKSGGKLGILRLPNVFGKWCRPNYNSVVATFCHNISRGLEITISDRMQEIELVYIDDVITTCIEFLNNTLPSGSFYHQVTPAFRIKLGQIADFLYGFRDSRKTMEVPNVEDPLVRDLYVTYMSYLPENSFDYGVEIKSDYRGILAELFRSASFGQLFISRTKPGAIRGNHYHDSKIEKFCVLEGEADVRLRDVQHKEVVTYHLSGRDLRIIDIPAGYTHSIKNDGDTEMIVLFWASEPFNQVKSDTYSLEVIHEEA